ncbi:MAG: hypothetical protein RLY21_2012 [Planctomycetota bacterium]|jgi:uncharacterized protein (DUF1800 family)
MPNPLQPLAKKDFDYAAAQHLLNRAGFGGTPAQVRALVELGLDDAVDYIVDFKGDGALPPSAEFAAVMRPETPEERETLRKARAAGDEETIARLQRERQAREKSDREQLAEMQKWWLAKMISTGRPLEEKLTLFWHGHFATGYRTIENSYHMLRQNGFLRANAAGNFADLVRGIIRDPAMLKYLDNDENRRRSPNENLARELMELFTLGEGNDYTERDIKEGARALTGMTFRGNDFYFNAQEHDPTPKTILGRTGPFSGDEFVSIILEHPVCSRFIVSKLYKFFVNDAPTPPKDAGDAVSRLAKDFRAKRYEIRPILKTLFRSQHFYAKENRLSVVKSPTQLMVQTIRSLGTPTREMSALSQAGDLMGQQLFQPPSVKGWDGGRAWINTATLFVRQNIVVYLVTGRRPAAFDWDPSELAYDVSPLIAHLRDSGGGVDPHEAVRALATFALGGEPAPERIEELDQFLGSLGGTVTEDRVKAMLCLIGAMPEYQLC